MSGAKGRSGGRRPGSGRKPKSAFEREVTGDPGHRGIVLAHSAPGVASVALATGPLEAPADLTSEERQVWDALAPHAIAEKTLVAGTAFSFRLLCRNVVLERLLAEAPSSRGGPSHRGMIQRVDAELLRFSLSPCGKAIYQAAPVATPSNPLDKFLNRKRG